MRLQISWQLRASRRKIQTVNSKKHSCRLKGSIELSPGEDWGEDKWGQR